MQKDRIEELDKRDIKRVNKEYMEIRNMNGTNRPSFRRRVLIEHLAHIKREYFLYSVTG